MKILALILSRMGSSRFPGKPMIGHVYNAVDTCDDLIKLEKIMKSL